MEVSKGKTAMPNGGLINLGDLTKPATVLIEKVSEAVGALFLPTQIKRVARADAEAAKIKAIAEIEVSDIQRRAIRRMVIEEGKKQENIENITRLALSDVQPDAKPEDLDPDWMVHFFARCRLVSDAEMQTLWGRLLAGEANRPGTFSKRTLDCVAALSKDEAQLFTNLCGFAALISKGLKPLVFDLNNELYSDYGISFSSLTHLEAIGLLRFEPTTAGFFLTDLPKQVGILYFGISIILEFPDEANNHLPVGVALLTRTGLELAPTSGAKPVDGFLDYLITAWRASGITVNSQSSA